jgi:diguanylate cyclase (GGDEF)-like protein/PAS domain S-box-containing protein
MDIIDTISDVAQYSPGLADNVGAQTTPAVPVLIRGRESGQLQLRKNASPAAVAKSMAALLGVALDNRQALQNCRELTEGLELDRVYFEELFEASPEAIAVLDADDRVVRVNRAFETLFGYTESEVQGRTINALIVPAEQQANAMTLTHEVATGNFVTTEAIRQRKDGSQLHASILGAPVMVHGDQVAIYAIYRDITAQKEAEDALRRLSTTDELTGLFNRRGFFLLAEQQRRLAIRERAELLLLYIDIDDFKLVNDTYGHLEGDQVLADIAHILQRSFRDSDILARMVEGGLLARMGGDEFVILAVDAGEEGEEILTTRLRERIERYNAERDRPYRVSLSIGAVRVPPRRDLVIDELLADADRLMYQHKRELKP